MPASKPRRRARQSVKVWVAVNGNGTIMHRTASAYPYFARMRAVAGQAPPQLTWRQLYRRGWRVVRAVLEVKAGRKG